MPLSLCLLHHSNIGPGDAITSQLFVTRTFVRSAVAPTALHDVQLGLVAQQSISIGELLTTTNTGTSTSTQLQLPAGFRSVAIVPPAALPPMQVGDHVDIIANGVVLAADALVLSLIENTTWCNHWSNSCCDKQNCLRQLQALQQSATRRWWFRVSELV